MTSAQKKWTDRILWGATWIPIIAGLALALFSKIVEAVSQVQPLPASVGQILAVSGAVLKVLRVAGAQILVAMSKSDVKNPHTWQSVILALSLATGSVAPDVVRYAAESSVTDAIPAEDVLEEVVDLDVLAGTEDLGVDFVEDLAEE